MKTTFRNKSRPVLRPFLSAVLSTSLLIGLIVPSIAQAPNDIRIALIIGNAAYPGNMALANPSNDAKDMAATLRNMGFGVIEVLDGNRTQMLDAIERANKQLTGKQGVGMLFYAGHGLQLDWRNYMVPVDAKLSTAADVSKQAVDIEVVMKSFQQAGNRMNIVVLDACRDDPFSNGKTSSGKGLAPLDAPTGTFLAYATAPGNVAQDGTGKNGLYTSFLLQELQRPTARIEDVFKRVRFAVRKASNGAQIPWETTSLEDDFVFNSGIKKVVAQPLPEIRPPPAIAITTPPIPVAVVEKPIIAPLPTIAPHELASAPTQIKPISRMNEDEKGKQFNLETTEWSDIKDVNNVDSFYAYLQKYPNGFFSDSAINAIERLSSNRLNAYKDKNGVELGGRQVLFRVGDAIEYLRTEELYTRMGKTSSRIIITKIDGSKALSDQNFAWSMQGEWLNWLRVDNTYNPPRPFKPAEGLVVGKKWIFRTDHKNANGYPNWTEDKGTVLAYENVTIPAGTFKAYKLQLISWTKLGTNIEHIYWLLPDFGLPIKQIWRATGNQSNRAMWTEEAVSIKRGT